MRNLFTKFALVAALVTLAPAAAFASDARVQSLGLQGDYIQDYTNVYAYPSSIIRYQNLVYGDLGFKDVSGGDLPDFQDNNNLNPLDNSGRAMGAYLNTWKWLPGTWGIQINENTNPLSNAYGASYYDRNRNQGIVLLWGNKIGEKTGLGLSLEKSNSKAEDSANIIAPYTWNPATLALGGNNARQIMNVVNASLGSEERNSWGAGAGVTFGWTMSGRDQTMDIGVHYRDNSLQVEDVAAQTKLEDNGNTSIAVNARAQMAVSDNSYLTPVVNYYTMSRGTKLTDVTTPANNFDFDATVSGLQIGIAESWVLRESDLLVMGINYNNENVEYDNPTVSTVPGLTGPFKITYNQTPAIFGALEVHPSSWFHVRMGAGKPVFSQLTLENKTTGEKTKVKDSPLQYAFGAGFRIGNRLDLDAVVNQDFAFTGTWFGSGNSEVPFQQLSMTYRF
jgi:hypothetical protein